MDLFNRQKVRTLETALTCSQDRVDAWKASSEHYQAQMLQGEKTIAEQVKQINLLNDRNAESKRKFENAQEIIKRLKAELEPAMKKEFVDPKLRDLQP